MCGALLSSANQVFSDSYKRQRAASFFLFFYFYLIIPSALNRATYLIDSPISTSNVASVFTFSNGPISLAHLGAVSLPRVRSL
ncbi:hypothetical protein F5Y14DRAFT_413272 [Nemania sp. NC0429]|nr:hypothetical protein F5Y14DRAFT_413272 [Nemania sp. NC0429]